MELTLPDMSQQEINGGPTEPMVHVPAGSAARSDGFSDDQAPASNPVIVVKEPAPGADANIMQEIACLKGHGDTVSCVAFVPGKRSVLSGSHDHALLLWDLTTGKAIDKFGVHPSEINCLAVTHDGKRAITGSGQYVIRDGKQVPADCMIRLFDLETGKELRHFSGHTGPVTSLAMAPDDSCFLSSSYDRTIRLWDMNTGRVLRSFTGHNKGVQDVVFGADSRTAISAGGIDGTVRVWDLRSGQEIACLRGNTGPVKCVVALPDGKHIISGGGDVSSGEHGSLQAYGCMIHVWDLTTGKIVHSFQATQLPVTSLACSPDGSKLLSGDVGGSICLWNLMELSDKPVMMMGDNGWIWASAFSADGHACLSAGSDHCIKLWKLP
jgi:WD40 repeat protein